MAKPKPIELKRKTGRTPDTDAGGRKLPSEGTIPVLTNNGEVPQPPKHLQTAGRELWERAWGAGSLWLSPQTDYHAVEHAASIADMYADVFQIAQEDPSDTSAVRSYLNVAAEYSKALSLIGFDPCSRGKYGFAEVKKQASSLDDLRGQRLRLVQGDR